MKLAEALFTINKTAKTYRDIRNDLKKLLFDKDDNITESSEKYIDNAGININKLIRVYDTFDEIEFTDAREIKRIIEFEEMDMRELESDLNIDEEEYNYMDEDEKRSVDEEHEFLQDIYDEMEAHLEYLEKLLCEFEDNQSKAHELLHDLRNRQNDIYDLKDKALFILNLPADSYHNVNGKIMKLVHYDGFSFHTFLSEDEKVLYKEGKIEASKSIEELIPAKSFEENELEEAIETVKAFIEENEEKLNEFEPHNSSYSSYSDYDDYDYDYDNYPEYYDNDEDDYY